jgi:hypothetical protein
MVKIVKAKPKGLTDEMPGLPTYQVVEEAYGDVPESRGEIAHTVLEAVNAWLSPNNDESRVAKFMAEIPIIEEEPTPEPIVGQIPHSNIINMVMSRGQSPTSYHSLTNWVLNVLGYEGGSADSTIPNIGYSELDTKFITELNRRIEKVSDLNLLLTIIEMADAGIRGYKGDKYNDAICEAVKDICLTRLQTVDLLPPSIWHKVHRHALWQESAETTPVSLQSPEGWISFSGIRPAQHGAWSVRMTTPTGSHESPQYVEKMGLKAKTQNQYAKGRNGVECHAFHLFNADGTLWGYEVYLISPKKTVGCEVSKDGTFSLFRSGVYLPPRNNVVRQGDALFRRIDIQKEDVISVEDLPGNTPREMQSVTIQGVTYKCATSIEIGRKEHRHDGYDYWHPISRGHPAPQMHSGNEETRSGYKYEYENVLILNEDAVLTHPDHPSIALKAGYWQVQPVEGETDYQPPQRSGD